MDNRKWLQRKYPKTFDDVNEFLNDEQLITFKFGKYKLGKLTENINEVNHYKKGCLCMFTRANPIRNYNYPLHPIIVKCEKPFTASGYHSFWVSPHQVEEIKL